MAKWSAIVLIMMVVIVVVAVEANGTINDWKKDWINCYRKCSKPCNEHDGNCFLRCKVKCGGPNPPHSYSRVSHGTTSEEVRTEGDTDRNNFS
ncbi:PREDICTED: uncharacterized protein LOC109126977 [Camelina sativa]|uniref:Uncharacterized protein LOC109126977 n=1 Tax=Camelina sativa TaxID=90675 RepID=A0ABM1QIF5_CAMSA|nr:PREDICTED: uncharacterized protein LOC109126977 [Camelina sativa]